MDNSNDIGFGLTRHNGRLLLKLEDQDIWEFDDFGCPLTRGLDGGDSCAVAANLNVAGFPAPLSPYFAGSVGVISYLCRHPDLNKWYGRPRRFSRDQLVALLCALIGQPYMAGYTECLFKLHIKRCFLFAWNSIRNHVYEDQLEHENKSTPDVKWDPSWKMPDICGPEVWALWIRALHLWPLWPLLILFDLESLVGAIHWRFWRKDNVGRNHMLGAHVAYKNLPTPTSWLTYQITPWAEMKRRWQNHCNTTGEIYCMNGIGK